MTRRLTLAMLGMVLLVGAEDKTEPPLKLSEAEKTLLELVNKERTAQKLPSLVPNRILFEVARAHSANMAKQREMKHILDGKNPSQRVKAAGYDYRLVGENIAWADGGTLAAVVKGWMESKHHRENILREGYTETGLGLGRSDQGEMYYTQVFATPQKKR